LIKCYIDETVLTNGGCKKSLSTENIGNKNMAFSIDGNKKSGKKIKNGARLLGDKVAKVFPFLVKSRFKYNNNFIAVATSVNCSGACCSGFCYYLIDGFHYFLDANDIAFFLCLKMFHNISNATLSCFKLAAVTWHK
jgi:hypothetical protein